MRVMYAAATVIAVSASAGAIAAQGCRPAGDDEPAAVLVENQRLHSENETLTQENVRLSTENENLQERLNELLIEGAGQETVALENVRLTGELQQARIELAEESARREELQGSLEEERRARLRMEQLLDNRHDRRNDSGGLGWMALLVVLLLASVAFWREYSWRSRVLKTVPPVGTVQGGTDAMARRVTDVASVDVKSPDR